MDVKFLDYLLPFRIIGLGQSNISHGSEASMKDELARSYMKSACPPRNLFPRHIKNLLPAWRGKTLQNLVLSKIMLQNFENIHSISHVQMNRFEKTVTSLSVHNAGYRKKLRSAAQRC